MGVLQRWGGGLSRRKRAALAAQEEAARVAAEQETARQAAEQTAAAEAARVAAETAQRQQDEAAQRQRDEFARQQAEILARQQTISAAPPINAQDVLGQAPTPSSIPTPSPFAPTAMPQSAKLAPFNVLPTVNIFSPQVQPPIQGSASSQRPFPPISPFTNIDPFSPDLGSLPNFGGQTPPVRPVSPLYQPPINIFSLRPFGGL